MVQPQYDTIHDSPIILQQPFPKPPGGRSGSLILVDRGDQYVVSCRYNDETTGKPQREWGQGYYFPYDKGPHRDQPKALAEALGFYQERAAKL